MLARENLLWVKATCVSQQALSQRLLTFPAEVFERVLSQSSHHRDERWSVPRRVEEDVSIAPLSSETVRDSFPSHGYSNVSTLSLTDFSAFNQNRDVIYPGEFDLRPFKKQFLDEV